MTLAIFQLIVFQFILPIIFIISLWKTSFSSKTEWMVQAIFTLVFFSWLFLSSSWSWFGYYLRFTWPIFYVVVIYRSWKKVRPLPFRIKFNRSQKWNLGFQTVLILIFGIYNVFVLSGYAAEDQAVELEFPLKNGTYYVVQGGDHVQINYHNAYLEQQYALDIVKLNILGVRATGIYPEQLEKYVIYGDELYSPCTGKVLEVRNHLSDLAPPDTDSERPEGNYVNLYCEDEDVNVYIAHMQKGSVVVKDGDIVQKGDPIGLVGNSGNTTEPHLHIHAERDGEGVPIRFNGRFLVRNSLLW